MSSISQKFRFLSTSAAALVAALVYAPATSRAGTFSYDNSVTSIYTETFDLLGPAGTSTSLLTGLPNAGGSPWTIGIITGAPTTTPTVTGTDVVVSNGGVAVGGANRLFNNGSTGAADRSLGTGNTGGNPVIDFSLNNATGRILSGIDLTFDTEYWRGGSLSTSVDLGYSVYFSADGTNWVQINPSISQYATTGPTPLDGNAANNRLTFNIAYTPTTAIASGRIFSSAGTIKTIPVIPPMQISRSTTSSFRRFPR